MLASGYGFSKVQDGVGNTVYIFKFTSLDSLKDFKYLQSVLCMNNVYTIEYIQVASYRILLLLMVRIKNEKRKSYRLTFLF